MLPATKQWVAVIFALGLLGHEALAARQSIKSNLAITELATALAIDASHHHAEGQKAATCSHDVIVSFGNLKDIVPAPLYNVPEGLPVLRRTKAGKSAGCEASYKLLCHDGTPAVVKEAWCSGDYLTSDVRPFDLFHWWRSVNMKSDDASFEFLSPLGLPKVLRRANGRTQCIFGDSHPLECKGSVKFAPGDWNCAQLEQAAEQRAEEISRMLSGMCMGFGENGCTLSAGFSYKKFSAKLKTFSEQRQKLIAMDCKVPKADTTKAGKKLLAEVKSKFIQSEKGKPSADERFDDAVAKAKSLVVEDEANAPQKSDVIETFTTLAFGKQSPLLESSEDIDRPQLSDELFKKSPSVESVIELEDGIDQCINDGGDSCTHLGDMVVKQGIGRPLQTTPGGLLQLSGPGSAIGKIALNVITFICFVIIIVLLWPLIWWLAMVLALVFLLTWPVWLLSALAASRHDAMVGSRVVRCYRAPNGMAVDVYARPLIHGSTGYPVIMGPGGCGDLHPVMPAPPLVRYITTVYGKPVFDEATGWPLAQWTDGTVRPFIGLPVAATIKAVPVIDEHFPTEGTEDDVATAPAIDQDKPIPLDNE